MAKARQAAAPPARPRAPRGAKSFQMVANPRPSAGDGIDERGSSAGRTVALATILAAAFIFAKPHQHVRAERLSALHLTARPYAHLEHPLELFGRIVPTVVVAQRMSRQAILSGGGTAAGVRHDVICVPHSIECSATNMAPTSRLGQNKRSIGCGKCSPRAGREPTLILPFVSLFSEVNQLLAEALGVWRQAAFVHQAIPRF